MKDYYQILGVRREATDTQIKTAYRKLVVLYHPDRNPDPTAGHKIREINEAYDVLGSAESRRRYDAGFLDVEWDRVWQPETPPHRDPAYHRRRERPAAPSQGPDINDLIIKYHPYAVRISIATLVFSMLMLIDFLLPVKNSIEKIIAIEYGSYYKRDNGAKLTGVQVLTNYNNHYGFMSTDPLQYDVDVLLTVSKSRLLGVQRKVATTDHDGDKIRTTIYGNFIFLPVVLLITSMLGVFAKGQHNLQYSVGVVNLFVLLLCIVLLFIF